MVVVLMCLIDDPLCVLVIPLDHNDDDDDDENRLLLTLMWFNRLDL